MSPLPVSLIIPTYNMSSHIDGLIRSIEEHGLNACLAECIIVNDGSTDDTLEKIKAHDKPWLKVISLAENQGRYWARFHGAQAASQPSLLFLDTRLELEAGFAARLCELQGQHEALMGVVNIDTSSSLFSLYWDRTHRWIWRKHFEAARKGFFLTKENFDEYLKGTTIFLCQRQTFLDVCELYKDEGLLSDDNAIMKHVVEQSPIWVDPGLGIRWKPRESAGEFLMRLWERGPSFVEYHVFERRTGAFFWASIMLLLASILWIYSLINLVDIGVGVFVAGLVVIVLSTGLFAKSPKEFARMAPLHLGVSLTFCAAVLYGLAYNAWRFVLRRERTCK
ncbi:glycosyltransferase [bacterium]|nr:glycosyltransferase [bacterium]